MSYLFRSSGTVIGITVSQCVLQNLLKKWLTERIHGPDAEDVEAPGPDIPANCRLLRRFVSRHSRYMIPLWSQ